MASTASEIIELAKSTKALSKEQISKILELAPTMNAAELEKLKQMIISVREAEIKQMKAELEVRKKANASYLEWNADNDRKALQANEGVAAQADHATAESLFKTI